MLMNAFKWVIEFRQDYFVLCGDIWQSVPLYAIFVFPFPVFIIELSIYLYLFSRLAGKMVTVFIF